MLKLYPIGTVVKVQDQDMNLMIVGYGGVSEKGENFDYFGIPSPYGFVDKNTMILFNDEQIETLHYMGYVDAVTQQYIAKIEEELKDQFPALK